MFHILKFNYITYWFFINFAYEEQIFVNFYIYLGHVWISGTKYTVYFEFIYLHFFKRRKLDINYTKKCFVDIVYGWVNLIVFALKFKMWLSDISVLFWVFSKCLWIKSSLVQLSPTHSNRGIPMVVCKLTLH